MIVGCYTLDLYCDRQGKHPDGIHAFEEFPHQYTHEFGSVCRARARRAGWLLGRDGSALCPKCSGKAKQSTSACTDFK